MWNSFFFRSSFGSTSRLFSVLYFVIRTNRQTDEASSLRLTASSLSWCSSIVTFSPVYQSSTAGTFTLLAVSELSSSQISLPAHTDTQSPLPHYASLLALSSVFVLLSVSGK